MPDGTSFERFDASNPIRVMLLLPSLHGGGAERVAVHLANRCDPRRLDVKIGLLRRAGPYLADVDPDRVVTPRDGDWLRELSAGVLGVMVATPLMVCIKSWIQDVYLEHTLGEATGEDAHRAA